MMYKLKPFVEQYKDKLRWNMLSRNPNANHLLEQNPDKINWALLSANPAIFEYDYEEMRKKMVGTDGGLYRDLMENRFHPRNVHKFEDWGFDSVY